MPGGSNHTPLVPHFRDVKLLDVPLDTVGRKRLGCLVVVKLHR